MEMIAQVFGFTFVGIILICIVWTFGSYVLGSIDAPGKRNKKLMDNMERMAKK